LITHYPEKKMAKTTEIALSGSLGDLIFYKHLGISCARTRPARVRLSRATRRTASLFGIASAMSAAIRRELVSLLPAEKDPMIMYQLNTVLLQGLGTGLPEAGGLVTRMPFISLYPMIDQNPAWGKMRVDPEINWEEPGTVTLTLPALIPEKQLLAPPGTESVRMQIMALSCKVANPCLVSSSHATFVDITYNREEQEASRLALPLTQLPGEVALLVLGLKYTVASAENRAVCTKKDWQPVDIIGAAYLPVK
jgi:hypothetical protein